MIAAFLFTFYDSSCGYLFFGLIYQSTSSDSFHGFHIFNASSTEMASCGSKMSMSDCLVTVAYMALKGYFLSQT